MKSVRNEKTHVEEYLAQKAEDTRSQCMAEMSNFEAEIRKRIDSARIETEKVDEKVKIIKDIQINAMQMILQLQRRTQELEVQLGGN